jgi:hypothetical protein
MTIEPPTDLPAEGVALLKDHFHEDPVPVLGRAQLFSVGGVPILIRTSRKSSFPTTATDAALSELDIEQRGAHFILFVTPRDRYLVPTKVAAEAYREAHTRWLASGAQTAGSNDTPAIHLDHRARHNDYAAKWGQYRIST